MRNNHHKHLSVDLYCIDLEFYLPFCKPENLFANDKLTNEQTNSKIK